MSDVLELEVEGQVTPTGVQHLEEHVKAQVTALRGQLMSFEVEMINREEFLPQHIQFGMLRDPRLILKRAIPLEVLRSGETVVATWKEASEFGYGHTWSEAVEDFSRTISELYVSLEADHDRLGPDLMAVLNIVREHIAKRG